MLLLSVRKRIILLASAYANFSKHDRRCVEEFGAYGGFGGSRITNSLGDWDSEVAGGSTRAGIVEGRSGGAKGDEQGGAKSCVWQRMQRGVSADPREIEGEKVSSENRLYTLTRSDGSGGGVCGGSADGEFGGGRFLRWGGGGLRTSFRA